MNSWWEIQVLCDAALDDLIFWRLEEFGCRGTSNEVKGHSYLVRAYLPQEDAQLLDLAALAINLRQDALSVGLPVPVTQWNLIDEEDWASSWKQHWQPEEIGDRFLINPAWIPVPEDTERLVIRLDPGAAFGTGAHATTQLCLESLEMRLGDREEASHKIIADVGCGSGILSIGALLLGVQQVYAVDTDAMAIKATMSNRKLNGLEADRLIAERGSMQQLIELCPEPVDGFLCNILAEIVIDLTPHFGAIAKPGTWGIISGVLMDQAKPVADTLEQNGWIVATLWRRQEWCCFNIRRA